MPRGRQQNDAFKTIMTILKTNTIERRASTSTTSVTDESAVLAEMQIESDHDYSSLAL